MKSTGWIALIVVSIVAGSSVAASPSVNLRKVWEGQPGMFAQAMQTGVGFSFEFDGRSVGPILPQDWRAKEIDDVSVGTIRTVFTHSSGLVVTREMRVMPEFNAVEYKVSFKNTAATTLPPVSDIRALDLSFGDSALEGACVISSGGGLADAFLPPRSFSIPQLFPTPSFPFLDPPTFTTQGTLL